MNKDLSIQDIGYDQEDGLVQAHISCFDEFRVDVENELIALKNDASKSIEVRSRLLDGGANTAAFSLIPEETRKRYGIFFTGHELSNLVASKISYRLKDGASVVDPACGAGDLLIACARLYPNIPTYSETMSYWAERLSGMDLHRSFLETLKLRLMLLATEFSAIDINDFSTADISARFSNFRETDALLNLDIIKASDCVVMNPPYGYIDAPPDIGWATGKLQLAGLFLDRVLDAADVGQDIVAVLPDVLRSGTRYEQWRKLISDRADILSLDIVGKFDKNTDVDVFVIHLKRSDKPTKGWLSKTAEDSPISTIRDSFNVHVGPVVPHRHVESGTAVPYIDCSVTTGKQLVIPTKEIRFAGKRYDAPFVAIHRTSSPDDKTRLVTSVVISDEPVAVENHIIIVQPHDKTIESCEALIRHLGTEDVRDWLNERIRCRHLTVTSIREIPY